MEKQTKPKRTAARSLCHHRRVHIKGHGAKMNLNTNLIRKYSHLTLLLITLLASICLIASQLAHGDSVSPQPAVISSRAAFLRAQRASRQSQSQPQQSATPSTSGNNQTTSAQLSSTSAPSSSTSSSRNSGTTSSTSTTLSQPIVGASSTSKPNLAPAVPSKKPQTIEPSPAPKALTNSLSAIQANSANQQQQQHSNNRSTRTADIFQNGDGFNIFVTNTCERELMSVNIRTSRPFYGVIHTRDQRQKSVCTVEGNGDTEYNMQISHVLNSQDPNYCGVIKARRESPEDKDLLSVVIAVRVHRNIELSDDKFFLLNCTNRCRRPDCSNPASGANNRLSLAPGGSDSPNARVIADEIPEGRERETVTSSTGRPGDPTGSGSGGQQDPLGNKNEDECTIWKFPWVITLLWCLGILLLAMIISHCIMCSSLVCRCVKTEVEEREPSVYEDDDTDDEDNLYNKKNHPMRIDYDNRDIYKTSNNYEPYNLDEAQSKSRARKGRARC